MFKTTKKVKPLRHYSLCNPVSIYDEEAMTALELAGRTAKKVNECVETLNDAIDEMPDVIKDNVEEHIENGAFDEQIAERTEELMTEISGYEAEVEALNARLSNAISGLTEDSETIDGRVAIDNVIHATIGDAIRKQAKRVSTASCFLNGSPVVEYSETSVKLTLPKATHVYVYGKNYAINDATASLNHSNSALFWVTFDYISNVIALQSYSTEIPNTAVIIGQIYKNTVKMFGDLATSVRTDPDSAHPFYVKCFCDSPAYVEELEGGDNLIKTDKPIYVFFGRNYYNTIGALNVTAPTGANASNLFAIYLDLATKSFKCLPAWEIVGGSYVHIGTYHRYCGVFLNAVNTESFMPATLCALILGDPYTRQYVEFDSVNKTVTFPNDTLILFNASTGSPAYFHKTITQNNVASYADITSSALKVYFNSLTEAVEIKAYSAPLNPNTEYLLAVFRTNGSVSINAPFKWNGKPYNIEVTSAGSVDAIDYNVKAINHRGYNAVAPENTLSAFKLSADNGFKYVECDVAWTSDDVPVLLHDETVDRTSNGSGKIADMTFAQARALDFGSWKSTAYAGEKIPSFEEFIALCKSRGLHPYIELKTPCNDVDMIEDIVNRYGMRDRVTYISTDASVLAGILANYNKSRVGLIVGTITESTKNTARGLMNGANEVFIDANYNLLNVNEINICINGQIPLEVWTVNDENALLTLDAYVSGVTSDSLHAGRVLYNATLSSGGSSGGSGDSGSGGSSGDDSGGSDDETLNRDISVSYNLTGATTDGTDIIPVSMLGMEVGIKITAISGYELPDTVTVTGCKYNWVKSTGYIYISEFTDDVSITVVCTKTSESEYTPVTYRWKYFTENDEPTPAYEYVESLSNPIVYGKFKVEGDDREFASIYFCNDGDEGQSIHAWMEGASYSNYTDWDSEMTYIGDWSSNDNRNITVLEEPTGDFLRMLNNCCEVDDGSTGGNTPSDYVIKAGDYYTDTEGAPTQEEADGIMLFRLTENNVELPCEIELPISACMDIYHSQSVDTGRKITFNTDGSITFTATNGQSVDAWEDYDDGVDIFLTVDSDTYVNENQYKAWNAIFSLRE